MARPAARDEGRHQPGSERLWNESYYFDWFQPDGSLGGYVRVGFLPAQQVVWYWACLVGPDRSLVTVVEHEVPLPASASSLELRGPGLWADHVIDEPLDRMTLSLESFGLVVDDPADMYRSPRGEIVPFGFELEWTTDRAAYLWPPVTPRYEIPCMVRGEVLLGGERIAIDGFGQRDHSWGAARDWWSMSWCWSAGRFDDGSRWHTAGGFFPDNPWGVGYELPADGDAFEEFDSVVISERLGREGLVERATIEVGPHRLDVEPIAWSPVLLVSEDGRESRFPRALCRVQDAAGRSGLGWIEFNQPPV